MKSEILVILFLITEVGKISKIYHLDQQVPKLVTQENQVSSPDLVDVM